MVKRLLVSLFSLLMVVTMSGCGDDNNVFVKPAKVSVLHASPDAPKVNILIDSDAALSGVDYAQGAALEDLKANFSYALAIEGILPGGATATVIEPLYLTFNEGMRYAVIATNDLANIEPLLVSAEDKVVDADQVRVQVIHATASAPTVDIYVTAPGEDITTSSPLGTLSFKEDLAPVEVPAGDYQIRITAAGSKGVLFDSGSVALAGGSDLMIAAIENAGNNGIAPVQLAVLDGETSSLIVDTNTPASLRVIHNSPDAPAVDIVVDNNFAAPLVTALAYPNFTPYVDVPENTYNVKVAVSGTTTSVIDADLTLLKATMSSVYAVNTVANIEPLILSDDNRKVVTEAKVRILHGSPTAGNVDIYVTAPGADIFTAVPAFTDIPFKAETGYVALNEGDYQVRVTPTGSKTVVIDTGSLSLSTGNVYTAIARDATPSETPGTFGLILLDDFN